MLPLLNKTKSTKLIFITPFPILLCLLTVVDQLKPKFMHLSVILLAYVCTILSDHVADLLTHFEKVNEKADIGAHMG